MPFVQSDAVAIDAAIKSGAMTVQYRDRSVTYRSMEELLIARQTILNSVNAAAGTRRKRTFRLQQSGNGL